MYQMIPQQQTAQPYQITPAFWQALLANIAVIVIASAATALIKKIMPEKE